MKVSLNIRGMVAAGLVVALSSVSPADVSFSRSDWPDLSSETTVALGTPTTNFFTAESTGGNPGSWVDFQTNPAAGSFITWTGLLENSWSYDPATEGAITSIQMSADMNIVQGVGFSFFQALIYQNGNYYYGIGGAVNAGVATWQNSAGSGLVAGSFWQINLTDGTWNTSSNPDFSASGAPIEFGYVMGVDGGSSGNTTIEVGLDNVNFDLHTAAVPEPSSTAAFAIGLGLLALVRRKRS